MITKNIIKNMILDCGTTILTQENTPQHINAEGRCKD